MLDAAVGLEVPTDELVPREFLLKVRLPEWPVRSEIEAAGLREWELSKVVSGALVVVYRDHAKKLRLSAYSPTPSVRADGSRERQYFVANGLTTLPADMRALSASKGLCGSVAFILATGRGSRCPGSRCGIASHRA
ncbi:hypothetical protein K2X89_02480 [Myxococcota bacterium]|nr:hypothetical protein [Myxococcota bacterium]